MNEAIVPNDSAGSGRRGAVAGAGAIKTRLAPIFERWTSMAPRERRLVAAMLAVIAVFVLWTVAVQPAWRTLQRAPAQLDSLDADLQLMQRLAGEAIELRAATPIGAGQSTLALTAASDRLGAKARLSVQRDRAVLTLDGIGSDALRGWLLEVRSGARARVIEAQLARTPQGYVGTLTVLIGGVQ